MAHFVIEKSRERFSKLGYGVYLNGMIVLLLVAGVGLTILSLQKSTQITSMADTQNCDTVPQNQTTIAPYGQQQTQKQLTTANNAFMQASRGYNFNQIHQAANERKKLLIQTMRTNPNLALTKLTTTEDPITVAKTGPNCIEEQSTVIGKVHVEHIDDFKNNVGITNYIVTDNSGKEVSVHQANGSSPLLFSGNTVKVTGARIDNDVLVNTQNTASIQPVSPTSPSPVLGASTQTTGNQNLLVVVGTFSDTTPLITPDKANSVVFGDVNSFYKENSYGKLQFTGSVYPSVVQVTRTQPNGTLCDIGDRNGFLSTLAQKTDLSQYHYILLFLPFSCNSEQGFSDVGQYPYVINNKTYTLAFSEVSTYQTLSINADWNVAAHELGHSLGLMHASSYDCGNDSLSLQLSSCTRSEYGDGFSVMGGSFGDFNAVHKDDLGWMDSSQLKTITQSGSYTLAPIENTTEALQAIKIQRGANDFLYAEYRQPIGNFDQNFEQVGPDGSVGTDIYQGALLHITDSTSNAGEYSYMFRDVIQKQALTPSDTFTDPATGTKIQTTNVASSGVTVMVTLGKTSFVPPTISFATSVPLTFSGKVPLTVNTQSVSGIQKVEYYYQQIGSVTGTPTLIGTTTLAPYTFVWDTTTVANGQYEIIARAYDNSGQQWNVPGNTADATIPQVTVANTGPTKAAMTSPTDGSTLTSSSQTFQWSTGNNVLEYWLWIGTTSGGYNIYNQAVTGTSVTVSNLPTNGGTIYVRLWSDIAGGWVYNDYTYTASGTAGTSPFAQISSPTPGSTISLPTTFSWKPISGAFAYWVWVGTTSGGYDISTQNVGTATQITVPSVPKGTSKIYIRLWTELLWTGWAANYTDSSFTINQISPSVVTPTPSGLSILSPAVGSALSPTTTFQWSSVPNTQAYWIWVGTTPGGSNISSQNVGTATSATVSNIPQNGSSIYVRIWVEAGNAWNTYKDFIFTTIKSTPTPSPTVVTPTPTLPPSLGAITSPAQGSYLPSSVTFQWSKGTGAQGYWLWVGTTAGSANIYSQNEGTATSATVSNIPQTGGTVYVRLWTEINGSWGSNYKDYTYTGGPQPTSVYQSQYGTQPIYQGQYGTQSVYQNQYGTQPVYQSQSSL